MRRYVIEREIPEVGTFEREQLRAAAAKSNEVLAQLAPDIRWQQSYVAGDRTFCIYLAKDEDVIRRNAESAYHPSCTCKIGAVDDPLAVLDPECRVRGVEALRVVDSSIFPTITNGNLNAPTIMVAEKAADLILDKEPLPASNAPYYLDEDWQIRQRPGEPKRALSPAAG